MNLKELGKLLKDSKVTSVENLEIVANKNNLSVDDKRLLRRLFSEQSEEK